MKRIVLSLLFALSAVAVQAQAPDAPVAPVAPVVAQVPTDATAPVAEAAADETVVVNEVVQDDPPRHCLRETGTRIKRRDSQGCTNAIGESYSGEELRRTGGRDTAEALRLLSPRFGG